MPLSPVEGNATANTQSNLWVCYRQKISLLGMENSVSGVDQAEAGGRKRYYQSFQALGV